LQIKFKKSNKERGATQKKLETVNTSLEPRFSE